MSADLTLQTFHFRAAICDPSVDLVERMARFGELLFTILDLGAGCAFAFADTLNFGTALGQLPLERFDLLSRMVGVKNLQIRQQRLIASGLSSLTLERSDLSLYLFYDVANAEKIRFRRFQLAQRLSLLPLIFGNSGCFFKDHPAIFRTRTKNQVNLALLHHRIGAARNACIGEEILYIAQPARRFVEQILRIAIPINAARHPHVVPINPKFGRTIGQRERDLSKAERLARVGSIENHIGHFSAAQRFG